MKKAHYCFAAMMLLAKYASGCVHRQNHSRHYMMVARAILAALRALASSNVSPEKRSGQ